MTESADASRRIWEITGSGTSSPLAGQSVTVTGVVTALRPNSGSSRGFYIQSATGSDEDGNPATSEGLLLFTGSSAPPACAAVGTIITVSGTLQDFVQSTVPLGRVPPTELSNTSGCSIVSAGNPLPAKWRLARRIWPWADRQTP